MNKKILIIDDDTRLRTLIGKGLEDNGFQISLAKDAIEAKSLLFSQEFNLIIVDIMMPGEDGFELTKQIRSSNLVNSKTPIIMLTARGSSNDRINGLEVGADDYLAKPFDIRELLLRINNIFRRIDNNVIINKTEDINICYFGDFTFNFDDYRLKRNNDFIYLTESEAKILAILCVNIGKVLSRDDIAKSIGDIDERSIDVQINRIRRKIEENSKQPYHLQTIRNQGYILHS